MLPRPTHRTRARRGPALVLAAVLAAAHAAHAQSPHFEATIRAGQARAALRAGNLGEAVRLFRASLLVEPEAHVFRELALALEQLGQLRDAAGAWTRYAGLVQRTDDRDAALARREDLRRRPSLLTVRVIPARAARSARVWFDRDRPRYLEAGSAQTVVEGGAHRVRVESPGYLPFEMMVPTGYGMPVGITAPMQPDPHAAPVAPDAPAPPADH